MAINRTIFPSGKCGNLLFIEEVEPKRRIKNGKHSTVRMAKWECDCGNIVIKPVSAVNSGNTRSCGCMLIASRKRVGTHKLSKTREYTIWVLMRVRCSDTNNKNYGGRGIKVCKRWQNSFENFIADMGKRPSNKYSIDRKNNDKGYSKSNCRWATRSQQNRNTRRTNFVSRNGKTRPLIELCEMAGINKYTVLSRLKSGFTLEEALTLPLNTKLKHYKKRQNA